MEKVKADPLLLSSQNYFLRLVFFTDIMLILTIALIYFILTISEQLQPKLFNNS